LIWLFSWNFPRWHTRCSGREIVYARDRTEVVSTGDGYEDTCARGVDGWRWVRGERGDVCAYGLEAPGRSEDDTLGSVVETCQCAASPKERIGQAQHERPVRVSDFDFLFRVRLIDPQSC
jgi:hypothetical protein